MASRCALRSVPLALAILLGCSAASAGPAGAPRATQPQRAGARPAPPGAAAPAPATHDEPEGERALADEPLFPGAQHVEDVPSPELVLGAPLGSRPVRHDELLAALRALESSSARLSLETIGRTHEGRELVACVLAAPERRAQLEQVRASLARLGDPRGLSADEAARLAHETPAVAWIGCSIHGDETSGVDAGLALVWHLASDASEATRALLDELVVVVDPCMNPDGRERILSLLEHSGSRVANLDVDGLHRGRWPYGRGNHYLFDMNRDWIWGTQPETRARWAALSRWSPQLVVDAHEMGALDTYLFPPARDPIHPHYPPEPRAWWARFAADQSAAFDAHGWSYYTREWSEGWYVGYSDSWGGLRGAIGILYEQARLAGQDLRRASGEIVTYREAVRRQIVSALANLGTLAANREAVLSDFAAGRRGVLERGGARAFVLASGSRPARERALVSLLLGQGVELERAEEPFVVHRWRGTRGEPVEERRFEAGTLVARCAQPLGALLQAVLELDPRMDEPSLVHEREKLERERTSDIYDVTAWSPALAFDLDAGFGELAEPGALRTSRVEALAQEPAGLVALPAGTPVYGWVVDGADDRSVAFAARALESGLAVHFAEEPFRSAGRAFARGSLLVRRGENGPDAAQRVQAAADAAGVAAFATGSGRSPDEGPDLGGERFHLLARPRVALLANEPVEPDEFGHVWALCDLELGLAVTQMDAQDLGAYDLRRYDVLVIPPASRRLRGLLAEQREALAAWIEAGGTLIAAGSSAAALADPALELTRTRLRRDALDELDAYAWTVERERASRRVALDASALWEGAAAPSDATESEAPGEARKEARAEPEEEDEDALARRDAWLRTFMPVGAFLRAEVDAKHWLSAGADEELAVLAQGDEVLLAAWPVEVPVRLAPAPRLRVAGLLWPEARERLADSAWLALEHKGHGAIVLFADSPAFRGWTRATQRMLANAIVYGPGLAASQPLVR